MVSHIVKKKNTVYEADSRVLWLMLSSGIVCINIVVITVLFNLIRSRIQDLLTVF